MPQPVIHVDAIRKTYGRTVAVDDVSFDVQAGEIFGLIGPNGAGKTTTMECVEGSAHARPRRHLGARPRSRRATSTRCRSASACSCRRRSSRSASRCGKPSSFWASLYRKPVDGDRLLEQLGLERQAQRLVHDAVGRPEAAAVHRARAHQRSRGRVPRRADDRTRSAGAARDLGSGARHPRSAARRSS